MFIVFVGSAFISGVIEGVKEETNPGKEPKPQSARAEKRTAPATGEDNRAAAAKEAATNVQQQNESEEYDYTVEVEGKGKFKGKLSSNVGVAVIGVRETGSIKGSYGTNTNAGGKFFIITLAISNRQKDAVTFDSSLVKLIDNQGREYSASGEGQTALEMEGREALFLKQINPGLTLGGFVVFDVPQELQAKDLRLQFKGGFLGRKQLLPLKVIKA